MKTIHLIIPMAGKGSRFSKDFDIPKPLITINKKPFFYWATKSITRYIEADITYIVLKEHVEKYNIDKEIKKHFPKADIVIISDVLNGAVLSCMEGIKNINDNNPIIFNDCDHYFKSSQFSDFLNSKMIDSVDGALLTFEANDKKYSYLGLDNEGNVIKTVEKQVISNNAICGAYYVKNKQVFNDNVKEYLNNCNYQEYFMSGIYNIMIKNKLIIKNFRVDFHISFGTPDEYQIAKYREEFKEII